MEFPKFPTDNLYKFAALSGLVAGILILGMLCFLLFSLTNRAFESRKEYVWISIQAEQYTKEMSKYEGEDGEYVFSDTEIANELLAEKNSLLTSLKEAEVESELLSEFVDLLKMLLYISSVFEVACIYFCIWGFNSWYRKLQHPLDQLLALRIQKMKL